MDNYLQNIINKYKDFKEYLGLINIDDFKKYTRSELKEFINELKNYNNFKIWTLELNSIIEQKKLEEYPELLGIHHYPEIKEIDFLSKKEKIDLDNYLAKIGYNRYIPESFRLKYRINSDHFNMSIVYRIFDFLESKDIVQKFYKVWFCYNCEEYRLFPDKEINQYLRFLDLEAKIKNITTEIGCFTSPEEYNEYYELLEKFNYTAYCWCDCDEEDSEIITKEKIQEIIKNKGNYVYKIVKQRDIKYDEL
jgi:hypothetical protein